MNAITYVPKREQRTIEVREHTFQDGNSGLQLVAGRHRIVLACDEAHTIAAGIVAALLEKEADLD